MIIYQRYVEKAEKIIFYIIKKVINLKFAKGALFRLNTFLCEVFCLFEIVFIHALYSCSFL